MLSEELLKDAEILLREGISEKKLYKILNHQGYSDKDIKTAIDTLKERNVAMKKIIEEASIEEDYQKSSSKKLSLFRRILKKIF